MSPHRSTHLGIFLALLGLLSGPGRAASESRTLPATPGHPAPVTVERAAPPSARPETAAPTPPRPTGVITSPWTNVGPTNQSGRTRCAALDLGGFSVYIGSDQAGLWQGWPFGDSYWNPLGDELADGVHVMAYGIVPPPVAGLRARLSPASGAEVTQRIAIGTDGGRLAYSDDFGYSWSTPFIPVAGISEVRRMARDGNFANIVYALIRSVEEGNTIWRVLRSFDSGGSWDIIHTDTESERPDLFVERGPYSRLNYIGGTDGNYLFSDDGGDTWQAIGAVLPGNDDSTWLLSGTEADSSLYAVNLDQLYRSTTGGASWIFVDYLAGSMDARTGSLCAAIDTPGELLYGTPQGGWYSLDSGTTSTQFDSEFWPNDDTYLHPTVTGIDCLKPATFPAAAAGLRPGDAAPQRGGPIYVQEFYIHTGGGTYLWHDEFSPPQLMTKTNFTNGQYDSSVARLRGDAPYDMVAGSRDRAQQQIYGFGSPPPASGFAHVTSSISNDVSFVSASYATRPDDPYIWSMFRGGLMILVGPGVFAAAFGPPDPGSFTEVPFLMADPDHPFDAYWGGVGLWKIHYDTATLAWSYTRLGVIDFSVDLNERVCGLGISPVDRNYWYMATSYGRIFTSANAGATWTLRATNGPTALGLDVTAIPRVTVTPSLTDRLVCTFGGSSFVNPPVLMTTDGGATFTDLSTGLPPGTVVWDMAYDTNVEQNLYAATSAGPFRLTGGAWVDMAPAYNPDGVPEVPFHSVESIPSAATMRFGTYGRGFFDYATGAVSAVAEGGAPAARLALVATRNPLPGAGSLTLTLPTPAQARVEAFDISGRRVAGLFDGRLSAGRHEVSFSGRDDSGAPLPNGVYFVRVTTPDAAAAEKVILAR